MDEDDRPRAIGPGATGDAASRLAGEDLSPYSLAELDARVALLEAEIARVADHRRAKGDHLNAAAALFGKSPG